MKNGEYPRDLVGYGRTPPKANWPDGAKLAVQFVLNYEEGAENNILHGDAASEAYLSEIMADPIPGMRHHTIESCYEYGSRVGVWRILDLFEKYDIPLTIFAVGMAVERYPELIKIMYEMGHEICSHGYRWISYQHVDEEQERLDILRSIKAIEDACGQRPLGWFTGRDSPRTRSLVAEEGGFAYDADDYNDDLPFWTKVNGKPHLVVPYTLDNNDMRFATAQGFADGEQYFRYLRDAFDVLYEEADRVPRMMSIGTHCRIVGRPGRIKSLERFIKHVKNHQDVWLCRRIDIANNWRETHPYDL
ncbi:MAG: allantoinase PuuE [Kiloniellales bacterium]|nr:allantoinase PuuE [Kiloniellales bacterium]